MVVKRNKGRRSEDKVNKLNGYVDTGIKVIITALIAFGVSNLTNIPNIASDIAVIKNSYENAVEDITENKGVIKEHGICLQDHEKRLIIIEKT